eukprot:CAMPEP_0175143876 /NCGR_PEP_ID=MMETSP0087-20121206/13759_1 /TAXON_ID=136419 /ORGANISM="Unknown Unknown, Strain D1" /LENGTH=514 /DNA_ID=CAMNT_0016428161 /DNA_START=102 /DNA_END=1646 /DNA_ORIENTATION=-
MGCGKNSVGRNCFYLFNGFSYPTATVTRIYDWRLAMLNSILKLGVIVHALFVQLISNKDYLAYENVVGTISLRVTNHSFRPNEPYCNQNLSHFWFPTGDQRYCENRDYRDINAAAGTNSELFIPTFVVYEEHSRRCPQNNQSQHGSCNTAWKTDRVRETYVASAETFEIEMEHSAEAPTFTGSNESFFRNYNLDMDGTLELQKGVFKTIPKKAADSFVVMDLLAQTYRPSRRIFNLDDICRDEICEDLGKSITHRQHGVKLSLMLHYMNDYQNIAPNPMRYSLRIQRLDILHQEVTVIQQHTIDRRTVQYQKGIHIVVTQSGKLGQQSWQAIGQVLVSAMAFVWIVNFAVDTLLHWLPNSQALESFKFIDFYKQDISEGPFHSKERIRSLEEKVYKSKSYTARLSRRHSQLHEQKSRAVLTSYFTKAPTKDANEEVSEEEQGAAEETDRTAARAVQLNPTRALRRQEPPTEDEDEWNFSLNSAALLEQEDNSISSKERRQYVQKVQQARKILAE